MELLQAVRTQWEGTRSRGALELAVREAEMQVGKLEVWDYGARERAPSQRKR
jgi:hypothetical protein